MRGSRNLIALAITMLLAVALAACGGSSSSSKSSGSGASPSAGAAIKPPPLKPGENPATEQLTGKKKGGVLNVVSNGDFEHLDPGSAYYALDYSIVQSTDRPLFSFPPNSANVLRPDLATAIPTLSNGGITDGGPTGRRTSERGHRRRSSARRPRATRAARCPASRPRTRRRWSFT
jgi:hypothetical protein